MKSTAIIALALLLLSGCSRQQAKEDAKTPPPPKPATPSVIDELTGKSSIDRLQKTKKKIKGIEVEHQRRMDEAMEAM